jgi:hypothetical protein
MNPIIFAEILTVVGMIGGLSTFLINRLDKRFDKGTVRFDRIDKALADQELPVIRHRLGEHEHRIKDLEEVVFPPRPPG